MWILAALCMQSPHLKVALWCQCAGWGNSCNLGTKQLFLSACGAAKFEIVLKVHCSAFWFLFPFFIFSSFPFFSLLAAWKPRCRDDFGRKVATHHVLYASSLGMFAHATQSQNTGNDAEKLGNPTALIWLARACGSLTHGSKPPLVTQ